MKALLKSLIIILMIPALAQAHEIEIGKFTKQKSIKKAYIVNPDAGIDIQNSYGNVYVTTWNEDKIELDIQIKVSGDREEWVNKKIDDIDVEIEALKSMVTAKTVISNSSGNTNGKNNSFEINYTIKIPKNGSVKINNKYGDVLSADLFANVNIKCKYGKVTMGKLSGNSNIIDIEYCNKSSVDYVKNGSVSADYSGLSINDFGNINLKADYTDINFTNGNNLKYDCSYGKLNYGKISNLEGIGDYLTIKVGEILNNLQVNTKYSKLTVDEMGAKAGNINVNSGYTSVGIGYSPAYSFDFDISLKFGNFKNDGDIELTSKQETNFSKSYQGYYKKQGTNKVSITSNYGNVSLTKNP
ncbi:hypothetical protein FNO01nite_32350 [Flavobacterium noncentrifugens]|uniref:Adhesin n=1 Tax=Flavobacterium noncentrifugens TaxID=1128970 RepID=A0A1G9D8S0_9FLAO|nr:DUF4097 domain-containing protein [Flavobacterium noncentrifugens]GEP52563.1 hypothetical protein FNO01nite_32350 [Flavobacterium noncentrifugens]SDK60251.1 hypothetical protein SAMN04487935_3746 [Flavobacterium noncentrifugens]